MVVSIELQGEHEATIPKESCDTPVKDVSRDTAELDHALSGLSLPEEDGDSLAGPRSPELDNEDLGLKVNKPQPVRDVDNSQFKG